ncbi:hypothetical protein HDU76_005906 [Blyttiomyces sp. JEL0837]|nr:hypothetical protein HDU76_005906 [Blyttiomyces sp. JEL0837]
MANNSSFGDQAVNLALGIIQEAAKAKGITPEEFMQQVSASGSVSSSTTSVIGTPTQGRGSGHSTPQTQISFSTSSQDLFNNAGTGIPTTQTLENTVESLRRSQSIDRHQINNTNNVNMSRSQSLETMSSAGQQSPFSQVSIPSPLQIHRPDISSIGSFSLMMDSPNNYNTTGVPPSASDADVSFSQILGIEQPPSSNQHQQQHQHQHSPSMPIPIPSRSQSGNNVGIDHFRQQQQQQQRTNTSPLRIGSIPLPSTPSSHSSPQHHQHHQHHHSSSRQNSLSSSTLATNPYTTTTSSSISDLDLLMPSDPISAEALAQALSPHVGGSVSVSLSLESLMEDVADEETMALLTNTTTAVDIGIDDRLGDDLVVAQDASILLEQILSPASKPVVGDHGFMFDGARSPLLMPDSYIGFNAGGNGNAANILLSPHFNPVQQQQQQHQQQHMQQQHHHRSNTSFHCPLCHQGFLTHAQFKIHVDLVHRTPLVHQCRLCGEVFRVEGRLKNHFRERHPEFLHPPQVLGNLNSSVGGSGDGGFLGHVNDDESCSSSPAATIITDKHLHNHRKPRHHHHHTSTAASASTSSSNTSKREKSQHKQQPKPPAYITTSTENATTSTSTTATTTSSTEPPTTPAIRCNFEGCGKTFRQVKSLIVHSRTHTGDRPFVCAVDGCGKAFSQASGLRSHNFTHTGERPYQCQFCLDAFTTSSRLKIHVRKHTEEAPYVCDFEGCGKAFKQSSNLKQHKQTHIPRDQRQAVTRDLACGFCGKPYKSVVSLDQHLRKEHPGKTLEQSNEEAVKRGLPVVDVPKGGVVYVGAG